MGGLIGEREKGVEVGLIDAVERAVELELEAPAVVPGEARRVDDQGHLRATRREARSGRTQAVGHVAAYVRLHGTLGRRGADSSGSAGA